MRFAKLDAAEKRRASSRSPWTANNTLRAESGTEILGASCFQDLRARVTRPRSKRKPPVSDLNALNQLFFRLLIKRAMVIS
jgi:hypothetical protein